MDYMEIAKELADLYRQQAGLKVRVMQLEHDAEAIEASLRPAEGWEGKNAEQREIAKRQTLNQHEGWRATQAGLHELRSRLIILQGELEALEAIRRAIEYQSRDRLADAIHSLASGHDRDDVDQAAAVSILDEAACLQANIRPLPAVYAEDDDEIPF